MEQVHAGVARVNITPPVGIPLSGFAGRGPATGIHDDLMATVLALNSGDQWAFIITMDLLFAGDELVQAVRRIAQEREGIDGSRVLLCASHTHYGPDLGADQSDVKAYREYLPYALVGALRWAKSGMEPVNVGFAEGEVAIGVNRRERLADGQIILGNSPEGVCDRSVRLVRLDTDDHRPKAALVNIACHGVTAAGAMREISPDWIGHMRQFAEIPIRCVCLFLQGAAGNINPIEMRHSWEPAGSLGIMAATEVNRLSEGLATGPAEGLHMESERVDLPAMTFPSVEQGEESVAALKAEAALLRAGNSTSGAVWWAENRLDRAEKALDSMKTGVPLPPIPAELVALRFGDVAIAMSPGEPFCEIGMEVKRRSPIPATLFAGYSNGSIGYLPVPAAYEEGGYEVTHACRLAPESAGIVTESSLALLNRCA